MGLQEAAEAVRAAAEAAIVAATEKAHEKWRQEFFPGDPPKFTAGGLNDAELDATLKAITSKKKVSFTTEEGEQPAGNSDVCNYVLGCFSGKAKGDLKKELKAETEARK